MFLQKNKVDRLASYTRTLEKSFSDLLMHYIRNTFEPCKDDPNKILEWRLNTASNLQLILSNALFIDSEVEESDLLQLLPEVFKDRLPKSDAYIKEYPDGERYDDLLNEQEDDIRCDVKAIDRMLCNFLRDELAQSNNEDFWGNIFSYYDELSKSKKDAIRDELDKPLKELERIKVAIDARKEKKKG